jgi:hypothetical protein
VLATLNMRAPLAERLKGRLAFWDAGVSMVAQRPLDGIGIGRVFKDVSRYATNPEALPRQQENAHNYFLQLAAEAGLPALVVLLAAWGAALRRAQADAGDGRLAGTERWAAGAAAAGLIGFAVTCLTGHSLLLREGQFVTWVVVAVALGPPLGAPRRQAGGDVGRPGRRSSSRSCRWRRGRGPPSTPSISRACSRASTTTRCSATAGAIAGPRPRPSSTFRHRPSA